MMFNKVWNYVHVTDASLLHIMLKHLIEGGLAASTLSLLSSVHS